MARSVAVIYAQLKAAVQADKNLYDPSNPDPNKRGLTSTSQVAYWSLWLFIEALGIALFEQILDIYKADVEIIVSQAHPNTPQWLQGVILKFQYSDTTPQVVQLLPNGTIGYPIINPALFVINQCAVVTEQNGKYVAKVAFNGVPLTTSQLTALAAYLDYYNDAGITNDIISANPDFVMVGATIIYNGQYDATIRGTIQDSITNFLASIPFNGIFDITDLYESLKQVPGVIDVVYNQVEIRASTVLPADATIMVNNKTWNLEQVGTFSGNAIPDTLTGRTLNDTLVFQAG